MLVGRKGKERKESNGVAFFLFVGWSKKVVAVFFSTYVVVAGRDVLDGW